MKYNFIIPYRNRKEYLDKFVRRFSRFLQETGIDAEFYVVHQIHPGDFNRGAMKNIGFLEFCKTRPDGLFIFHDVDTYPTYWGSIQYDTKKGTVRHPIGDPHENLGMVACFWKEEFERVNGFPNYWGWGIEDVTIWYRLNHIHIPIDEHHIVSHNDTVKCYAPKHVRNLSKEGHTAKRNTELHLQEEQTHEMKNGISNLEYRVLSAFELAPHFTVLNVDFTEKEAMT